jgi:hypothetical protein
MQLKRFGSFLALVVIASSAYFPSAHAWNNSTFGVLNLSGIGGDNLYGIATDPSGNIYMSGYTSNQIDVDPSPTSSVTLTTAGSADVFVAKYTSAGDLIWGKSFGGSTAEYPYGMDVDSSGNVYITGTFQNTVDFDPSAATANLTSKGNADIFIVKFSTSGNFLWVKQIGGTQEERATSLTLDSGNNILITGFFNQTIDFNPAPLETVTSTGLVVVDIFVLKLNSDGLYQWAKQIGDTDQDMGQAIAVDSSDNVYVTGKYRGSPDFDPGVGTATLVGSSNDAIFILKLTSAGAFTFAKSFANSSNDEGSSIEVDASGNIYSVGVFQGTLDFDPGAGTANLTSAGFTEGYISKLDSSGNYLWAKAIGGTDYDQANVVSLDSSGNPLIGGYFSGTVDFDPGAGINSITAAQVSDGYVLKLSAAGDLLWVSAFRGQGSQTIIAIDFTSTGYPLIGGHFNQQIDFDPSTSVTLNFYPSSSFNNVFLVRLAPDGTLSPATLIDKAAFNSLGLSGGGIVATFRTSATLVANVNVAAKVSFQSNGKYLPGCRNLIASGSGTNFSASCTWKPSIRGSALITAIAVPTAAGVSAGTSFPINLVVTNRSGKR